MEVRIAEDPALLLKGRAMVTAEMGRSVGPKALEMRRRMVVAGRVRCIV